MFTASEPQPWGSPAPEMRATAGLMRERLLECMASKRWAAIVLEAPGGFGKSTLLSQWVARDARHSICITVRQESRDAHAVAQALVTSLQESGLVAGDVPLPSHADEASWDAQLAPFGARLRSITVPVVVVLDDAQRIIGEPWEMLLRVIVESLPPGSTVAVATRAECPRTLRRLRVSGTVLEIGPSDLAFDREEVARLCEWLGVHSSDQAVNEILDRCSGWPAVTYLLTRRLAGSSEAPLLAVSVDDEVEDFLRDEVVSTLTSDEADLLLRSSVLGELSGEACEALTGAPKCEARLRSIARKSHLISVRSGPSTTFGVHQLLTDHLRREFSLSDPSGVCAAHKAAARFFDHQGDVDAAAFHARRAGDDNLLASLIWKHCPIPLASGQSAIVDRWMEGVDEDRVNEHAELAVVSAWVASHQGDMDQTQRLLARLEHHASSPDLAPEVLDAIQILRCTLGEVPILDVVSSMRDVAGRLGNDPWATIANFMCGIGLALCDDVDEAREFFMISARLSRSLGMPLMEGHSLCGLVDLALTRNQLAPESESLERLHLLAQTGAFDGAVTSAPIRTTLAEAWLIEGDALRARAEADRALRQAALMRSVAPWAAVHMRLRLAGLYLRLGQSAMAQQLVVEARELHGTSSASPALDRALKSLSELVTNPVHDAQSLTTAEIRVLQYLPTQMTLAEIADRLFVSRNTVKTQVNAVYRKLGATSRTDAVEAARGTGLLPPR